MWVGIRWHSRESVLERLMGVFKGVIKGNKVFKDGRVF